MVTLSGAVLILAAAVVFGAAIIGHGLAVAAGRDPGGMPTAGIFAALVLGVMGLGLLLGGLRGDRTRDSG